MTGAETASLPPKVATDTHDFAPFVRIIGRGPGRSRSLARAEARAAFAMILRGEARQEQVGAFLMLLRYRGETAEELAGFIEASHEDGNLPWVFPFPIDLDWPSYADGRTRGLPWYLMAALLVARSGVRVLMHGPLTGPGRAAMVGALRALGIAPATDRVMAELGLTSGNFAFVPLESLHVRLAALLALRGVLGLRSPVNTIGRLLDPAGARASIDGVFHPAYIELHMATAALIGRRITVLKGGGGEAEWTGTKPLALFAGGQEQTWPARPGAGVPLCRTPEEFAELWFGRRNDPAAETVVIATAAVALRAIHHDASPEDCLARATALWIERGT